MGSHAGGGGFPGGLRMPCCPSGREGVLWPADRSDSVHSRWLMEQKLASGTANDPQPGCVKSPNFFTPSIKPMVQIHLLVYRQGFNFWSFYHTYPKHNSMMPLYQKPVFATKKLFCQGDQMELERNRNILNVNMKQQIFRVRATSACL